MTVKTDRLITLFGGGGFLGRYVAQALFKAGARVRIAEREPKRAFFLRPLGGLGQIQFVRVDLADKGAVAAAVHGADAVVNLVGILKGDFQRGPCRGRPQRRRGRRRGRRARLSSTSRRSAPTRRARAPMAAPRATARRRSAPPSPPPTIIRPSIAFGREDDFVNRFARLARLLPVLPVIRGRLAAAAGPRRRPRQGDRSGRARPRALMPAGPTSSAARRC